MSSCTACSCKCTLWHFPVKNHAKIMILTVRAASSSQLLAGGFCLEETKDTRTSIFLTLSCVENLIYLVNDVGRGRQAGRTAKSCIYNLYLVSQSWTQTSSIFLFILSFSHQYLWLPPAFRVKCEFPTSPSSPPDLSLPPLQAILSSPQKKPLSMWPSENLEHTPLLVLLPAFI